MRYCTGLFVLFLTLNWFSVSALVLGMFQHSRSFVFIVVGWYVVFAIYAPVTSPQLLSQVDPELILKRMFLFSKVAH